MKLLLLLMLASCEPPVHGFVPHPFVTSKITTQVETFMYSPKNTGKEEDKKYCIPLDELRLEDLPKVGGKTASLGEMIQQLAPLGVSVPGGFGVTSSVYDAVLDRFELRERLQDLLKDVDGTYNMQCCGRRFPCCRSHVSYYAICVFAFSQEATWTSWPTVVAKHVT